MARLRNSVHYNHPRRIHQIADGFVLEDLWSIHTPGAGPEDFPALLEAIREAGAPGNSSPVVRALFALRWRLGAIFGWDRDEYAPGAASRSLTEKLPEDLCGTVEGEPVEVFRPLYRLPNEYASEIANATTHAVMHLGWVQGARGWELRFAVLVRPRNWFGRAYLAAILPFRRLLVYPSLTRQWKRAWLSRLTAEHGRVEGTRGEAVTSEIRALGAPEVDAVDCVSIRTEVRASAEEWAQILLRDAAGTPGQWIWRKVLRLPLAELGTSETIAGWPIESRGDGWVRLSSASRSLTGQLVICAVGDRLSLATFVRYRRPAGRMLWRILLPVHLNATSVMVREAPALMKASGITR
ncbi:DUF2867 domain-containing protein [Glutamicibacter endophyticus]|uniref:DUF2867 domain-containing protein n=1 Tax=Glutamicibacter endophyticus TaxID=1522174 RepID=UPI003AEFFC89